MLNLICEGPCNGGLVQEFDAAIKKAGRAIAARDNQRFDVEVSNAPASVLAMTQRMRYTRHIPLVVNDARCMVCGTVRRWR
jgi:hypothetical protein